MPLEFFSRSSNFRPSPEPSPTGRAPADPPSPNETLAEPTVRISAATVLVGASVLVIYLATLTSDYYWDGITFALQIDKVTNGERGAELLFHQNHLLYNAIGYVTNLAADAIGFNAPTITLLQLVNAFAGALSIAVFFQLAERATRNRYVAIVCSAALAVSAARWKVSTDADAYILTMLLILICASNLLGDKPRWFVAGAALAAAMLVHQIAALFFPAAVVAVFTNRRVERKWKFALGMSALAWTVTISGYYLCAALLHGLTHPVDVLKWVTSNPSEKALTPNPLRAILLLPKLNFDAIIGHNFGLFRSEAEAVEIAIVIAAIIAAFAFVLTFARKVKLSRSIEAVRRCAPELKETRNQFVPVLVTWVAVYAFFLLFWGPLIYFRAFYSGALALGFALVLCNYHLLTRARPSGAAALGVAALALFNLGFYIGPNIRANANVLVAAARGANEVWNERTVIYFADRNEADTAFEYFNNTTVWHRLTSSRRLTLESEIAGVHAQGGEVWLNSGAVELLGAEWMSRHGAGHEINVEVPNAPVRYARYVRVRPEQ